MRPIGLDHVVVVVDDMDDARAKYARVFGEEAVGGVLQAEGYLRCVIRLGTQRIELCQPVDAPEGAEQANRAFRATLSTRGEGIHNFAVEVADVDAVLDELHTAGVPLIKSRFSRSFFIHPEAMNGALIQVLEANRP
jgi:catechol 2,3-dioxygenase-like lactoylglutathione lyase family enzyme